MQLGNSTFRLVCGIDPVRSRDGKVVIYDSAPRYHNRGAQPLHAYGSGPFCKFKIPSRGYETLGVYALIADGDEDAPRYIGKALNLAKRFNMGYGNISPINCYRGGQQTNCRLNKLTYSHAAEGRKLDLWFAPVGDIDAIERGLIARYSPPWNLALAR